MDIKEVEIVLYVADQSKSRDFYSTVLGKQPVLDVPGMTEFALSDGLKLGLMPETGIAKILAGRTAHPATGSGIPRCELYLYTDEIDVAFARALRAGAKEISPIAIRDWGDTAGYVADPDGHIIAFATS
jgi:catechol 2,3-dioxygenase-like lactoylglutathione lyase family enzyme